MATSPPGAPARPLTAAEIEAERRRRIGLTLTPDPAEQQLLNPLFAIQGWAQQRPPGVENLPMNLAKGAAGMATDPMNLLPGPVGAGAALFQGGGVQAMLSPALRAGRALLDFGAFAATNPRGAAQAAATMLPTALRGLGEQVSRYPIESLIPFGMMTPLVRPGRGGKEEIVIPESGFKSYIQFHREADRPGYNPQYYVDYMTSTALDPETGSVSENRLYGAALYKTLMKELQSRHPGKPVEVVAQIGHETTGKLFGSRGTGSSGTQRLTIPPGTPRGPSPREKSFAEYTTPEGRLNVPKLMAPLASSTPGKKIIEELGLSSEFLSTGKPSTASDQTLLDYTGLGDLGYHDLPEDRRIAADRFELGLSEDAKSILYGLQSVADEVRVTKSRWDPNAPVEETASDYRHRIDEDDDDYTDDDTIDDEPDPEEERRQQIEYLRDQISDSIRGRAIRSVFERLESGEIRSRPRPDPGESEAGYLSERMRYTGRPDYARIDDVLAHYLARNELDVDRAYDDLKRFSESASENANNPAVEEALETLGHMRELRDVSEPGELTSVLREWENRTGAVSTIRQLAGRYQALRARVHGGASTRQQALPFPAGWESGEPATRAQTDYGNPWRQIEEANASVIRRFGGPPRGSGQVGMNPVQRAIDAQSSNLTDWARGVVDAVQGARLPEETAPLVSALESMQASLQGLTDHALREVVAEADRRRRGIGEGPGRSTLQTPGGRMEWMRGTAQFELDRRFRQRERRGSR